MGIELRMEPFAERCEKERPQRPIYEFCFRDIDKLFNRFGLNLNEFRDNAEKDGRLPHDVALRLIGSVESHRAPAELLALLHQYRAWYEQPENISTRMQVYIGSFPGLASEIGHWPIEKRRPWP
jgi:hypothetical protein